MMEMLARDVRKFIYDRFRETSRPPVVEEIMRQFKLSRQQVADLSKILESNRQLVLVPGTERIIMAHPFSAIATPFRVRLKGAQEFFANCSWDSIAFHAMLEEDVKIESHCHHCGEKIEIELANEAVESAQPKGAIVYLGLPAARWWENIIHACSNTMLFFSSEEHLHEWLTTNKIRDPGQTLTVDQTIKLSVPIYKGKMDIDYERPSASELSRHFRDLGLEGAFWEI